MNAHQTRKHTRKVRAGQPMTEIEHSQAEFMRSVDDCTHSCNDCPNKTDLKTTLFTAALVVVLGALLYFYL